MKITRMITFAAAGTTAFLIGFAGVGAVAFAADTITTVFGEGSNQERTIATEQVETKVEATPEVVRLVGDTETVEETQASDDDIEFYGAGTYYASFDDETAYRGAFKDIAAIDIETHDFEKLDANGEPGLPIPPRGFLIAKKNFKFSRIAINGKTISFQTEEVDGVSFKFTGKFNYGELDETGEELPDLSGQLIKFEKKKWAAATKIDFYSGGCSG